MGMRGRSVLTSTCGLVALSLLIERDARAAQKVVVLDVFAPNSMREVVDPATQALLALLDRTGYTAVRATVEEVQKAMESTDDPLCASADCAKAILKERPGFQLAKASWEPKGNGRCKLQVTLFDRNLFGSLREKRRFPAEEGACSKLGAVGAISALTPTEAPDEARSGSKRSLAEGIEDLFAGNAPQSPSAPRPKRPSGGLRSPPKPSSAPPPKPKAPPAPAPKAKSESAPKSPEPEPRPFERRVRNTKDGKQIVTPNGTVTIHDSTSEIARARTPPPPPKKSAGVKAGSADDNLQFGAFLRFLKKNTTRGLHKDVEKRLIVTVQDKDGLPLANATVVARNHSRVLATRRTYADGRTLLFPSEWKLGAGQKVTIAARHGGREIEKQIEVNRAKKLTIQFDSPRPKLDRVPLDIAFILDTTGSMGDQIERLKRTIDVIQFQIMQHTPRPDVRFGMVLYRDEGDDYRTEVVPLTKDLVSFRWALFEVEAGGGGDYPEDVQAALEDSSKRLGWRNEGVRVAFLVGDAPPHLDYRQPFDYLAAMDDAAERGIKIATVGASGLNELGELVWRQLAQYTMAPFVFLTRGETGDSEGSASTVSHHIGSNWVADNLDSIVVRLVKLELSHYGPRGAPTREDFFLASYSPELKKENILSDLFYQSVQQLADYSLEGIAPQTPTVVLPVVSRSKDLSATAKDMGRRLSVAIGRDSNFKLVAEQDKNKLVDAMKAQYSDFFDESKVPVLGKLVPARLLVMAEIDKGSTGQVEMLLKLVRMETAEVLSVSLLRIDDALVL